MNPYISEYRHKLTTPEKAAALVGQKGELVHGSTVAEPPALLAAIAARIRAGDLKHLKVFSALPMQYSASTILSPDISDCVESYSWFATATDRGRIKVGLSYYIPNHLHQIPRYFRDHMEIDTVVTTVSPMDEAGFFTFGAVNDFTCEAARHCKKLIVEVNSHMPRVFGNSLVHISEITALVENHVPLHEISEAPPKLEDELIAGHIAGMIPDGATIELGLGGIPNAIARRLTGHKHLGVHSGLMVPSMIDLIEKGVITGQKKNLHPRKHIFVVAQGSKKLYDFVNDNPIMESFPSSYTENASIIALNDNMHAINTIIEVDLTGQCNAEHMAGSQFSGAGGQLAFVQGAFNSAGGKSIQAFYATAKNGKASRIVPRFKRGTVITVPRNDVQYLATEYGIVNLKGKSTRDRALAVISLAHPDFREGLLREAEDLYLL